MFPSSPDCSPDVVSAPSPSLMVGKVAAVGLNSFTLEKLTEPLERIRPDGTASCVVTYLMERLSSSHLFSSVSLPSSTPQSTSSLEASSGGSVLHFSWVERDLDGVERMEGREGAEAAMWRGWLTSWGEQGVFLDEEDASEDWMA